MVNMVVRLEQQRKKKQLVIEDIKKRIEQLKLRLKPKLKGSYDHPYATIRVKQPPPLPLTLGLLRKMVGPEEALRIFDHPVCQSLHEPRPLSLKLLKEVVDDKNQRDVIWRHELRKDTMKEPTVQVILKKELE